MVIAPFLKIKLILSHAKAFVNMVSNFYLTW